MKVSELLEGSGYGKQYTEQEFKDLPEPNASNIEGAFRVGKTVFDNERGLGQTPNNQNVVYAGFAVEMKPSTFLRLAAHADRKEDGQKFAKMMLDHVPFGSPTLYVDCNLEEWQEGTAELWIKVKSHEGRGRMWAFDEVNGNVAVPVHVFVAGLRARHLTKEFFTQLRDKGFIPEDQPKNGHHLKVNLGRIFCNGETL